METTSQVDPARIPTILPTRSVLAVDDEPAILRMLVRVLEPSLWRVTPADGVEAALGLLRASAYDVVLSDYVMPGGTGLAVLRFARERRPGARRVLMTGAITRAAEEALEEGLVRAIVTKPFCVADLLRALTGDRR